MQCRQVMGIIVLAACSAFPLVESLGQEKSVRPGINAPFRDPEVKVDEWVKRFEGESREVYDKRNAIIAALKLKPGTTVADVGAGTGLFTRLFAEKVTKTGTVYAVDISPKLLDYIRLSAEKFELPQVKTVLGKDTSVELPQGSVDLVFICDTYHHFEFPEKMMTSIHEALRPGGQVVIIDFVREPGQSSDWVLEHVRAGQKVVEQEVAACGFRKVAEVDDVLTENYLVIFEKQESPRDGKAASPQSK